MGAEVAVKGVEDFWEVRDSAGVRVRAGMNIHMIRREWWVNLEIKTITVGIVWDLGVSQMVEQNQKIARNYQNMKCTWVKMFFKQL